MRGHVMTYSEGEFHKLKVKSARHALNLAKNTGVGIDAAEKHLAKVLKDQENFERSTAVLRRSEGKKGQRIGGIDV